jgi:hypothetical protein
MKHLNPELEKLEQRIVPDLLIGGSISIGIGVIVGVDGTTQCGCTSSNDFTHSTGPYCTS